MWDTPLCNKSAASSSFLGIFEKQFVLLGDSKIDIKQSCRVGYALRNRISIWQDFSYTNYKVCLNRVRQEPNDGFIIRNIGIFTKSILANINVFADF